MTRLPIDDLVPNIVAALRSAPAVVIEAPPGAGKTTRVPRALLEQEIARAGEILVLQPRRLPARLAAARVAAELNERPGRTIGYTVRFEDVSGPETRIRFITEGVLTRRLMGDPTLRGVSTVVLDEFHERHLAGDVALAVLKRLQRTQRPDLKLCVMSATLDAAPLAKFLDDCPRLRSEGRQFDVRIDYHPDLGTRPIELRVAAAVRVALAENADGDVLVFLPGLSEIRRCEEALAPLGRAANLLILPLHGDLPLAAQARVVTPAERRKVILSTNVAETSVTIDGVVAVVDTGLARIAGHSQWTGLPTLGLAKISQASAIQRAGRAGRTRPGIALRLYARADFDSRPTHDIAEIERSDLTDTLLTLHALGVSDPDSIDWLTPPPLPAVAAAKQLLQRLGALGPDNSLTALGRSMLRFPTHPRLARLLVEGEARLVARDAATTAALIAERDIRQRHGGSSGHGPRAVNDTGTDVITLLETFDEARAARFAPEKMRTLGLDPRATATVEQARQQLAGMARSPASGQGPHNLDRKAMDRALCRAILAAFPDRVGRRRETGSRTVLLAAGGTAELGYEPDSDFIVALDAEELAGGRAGGRGPRTVVRLGCGIDPDWLLDLAGEDLRASDEIVFDDDGERVVRRSRLTFGSLVLEESVTAAEPGAEVSRLLAEAALARGIATFDEPAAMATLKARLAVVAEFDAELTKEFLPLDESILGALLRDACAGLRNFNELRQAGLVARLMATFPPRLQARLASEAPLSATLPGGRVVRINYQPDQSPWIESRLQDFFGMARGPSIASGRVALTLHLLAPNGRSVQVTRDLESFWRQHYPTLRRELGRRYPRHPWPEDGRTATPAAPSAPRRRP